MLTGFIYWGNVAGLAQWMPASGAKVFHQHEYWRLWTALFIHSDLGHLLANCFLFFILGAVLNTYFGLFVFPLVAVLFGGLINFLVLKNMPLQTSLVGISGVVFWLGGFWLVLYMSLDRRRTVKQRVLRVLGVAIALFMPSEAFDPSISYQSHFLGFVLGAAFGFLYFFARKKTFRRAEVVETIVEDEDLSLSLGPQAI